MKETSQPKAVNIIRPSNTYIHNNHSLSSNGSAASNGSQQLRRTTSNLSSTVSTHSTSRKPRVVSSTVDKPHINLYQPTRKPSYDNTRPRPNIDLYKPPQQRLTKSLTAPSLSLTETRNNYNRPSSPSYFRQSQQQHHRSVLGVINTPATHTSADSSESVESSDQDIEEDDTSDKDEEEDENIDDVSEEEEEEDDIVNEARVNRKIADLELSINSLLTVNSMLESTVRKQASQLNQLKKQKSVGEFIPETLVHQPQEEELDKSDDEDWENDELFQKLKKLTEIMIEEGQKSIQFEYKILGRVLSNYEPEIPK